MSNQAYNVVEFAKSQVEWMSDKILKTFEDGRYNPFQFRHVQLCHKTLDLNRIRSPKVVLASEPDMECGFSRELFLEWCADTKNSVILTSRSSPRTLASKLIHMATGGPDVSRHLNLEIKRKIPLEGAELEEFWRDKKEKEQEAARLRMEMQRRSSRVETVESSDESDTEDMDVSHQCEHPYDIMYKFEQQQKSSFFKQAKKTYPMYPYIEEKVKWDDYGEIIRPEDYMLPDSVIPGNTMTELKRDRDNLGDSSADSMEVTAVEIPSKCIISKTKLEVMCQVAFIDFEGRSDGESVKKLLNQIKPKQLILVHGTAEATRNLAAYCTQHKIAEGRIFTPVIGETVDATIESHIYQVTLTDVLMSSLEFQPVKDAELAWVDTKLSVRNTAAENFMGLPEPERLAPAPDLPDAASNAESPAPPMDIDERRAPAAASAKNTRSHGALQGGNSSTAGNLYSAQFSKSDEGIGTTVCLDILPPNAIPPHVAVFVNDPKLSDLKQLLMMSGFQAEFSGGVLYVNNVISIRRNEAGRFNLEGSTSEDYYRIRDLVYKQFAIV